MVTADCFSCNTDNMRNQVSSACTVHLFAQISKVMETQSLKMLNFTHRVSGLTFPFAEVTTETPTTACRPSHLSNPHPPLQAMGKGRGHHPLPLL
jgi:hypothetical protein